MRNDDEFLKYIAIICWLIVFIILSKSIRLDLVSFFTHYVGLSSLS